MTQTDTVKSPEAWWASLSRPTWVLTDSLMQPSSSCSSPSALEEGFIYTGCQRIALSMRMACRITLDFILNQSPLEDSLTRALLARVCLTELDQFEQVEEEAETIKGGCK